LNETNLETGEMTVLKVPPQKILMSTQEAAHYLNVSGPFVVKQLEEKKMDFIQAGTHRRIEFHKLVAFRNAMKRSSAHALQELADQAQELDMGY
jgi:excisionase family DNA binding protein